MCFQPWAVTREMAIRKFTPCKIEQVQIFGLRVDRGAHNSVAKV